jgi:hypothetical protein
MVTGLNRSYACANFANDTCAFMAKHAGEDSLAVKTVKCIGVGMANAGSLDLDQHFASLWAFQIQFYNFKRLFRFKRYGCAGLHIFSPNIQYSATLMAKPHFDVSLYVTRISRPVRRVDGF